MKQRLPSYAELPIDPSKPPHSAWSLFGEHDQLGTLNLIRPGEVVNAAKLVRRGEVFTLNWDIDLPDPGIYGRRPPIHHINHYADNLGQEDWFDSFYAQGSSQWDALAHIRHPTYGFYNGFRPEAVAGQGGELLGIQAVAQRGIAGRFVLLDIARHRAARGNPLDCAAREVVSVTELSDIWDEAGLTPGRGDILLLHFGWTKWYENLSQVVKMQLASTDSFTAPGIATTEEMERWLWDMRFAAVAADCPAVEAVPTGTSPDDYLHLRLIPLLGMLIGELFTLDALAEDCAATSVYEGLFVAAPLRKTAGLGSPANAVAIK